MYIMCRRCQTGGFHRSFAFFHYGKMYMDSTNTGSLLKQPIDFANFNLLVYQKNTGKI